MSDLTHGHDEHSGHDAHPPVPYFKIFATLLIFTAITILASFLDLRNYGLDKWANVLLAMGIATFKASLVMLFFMHLKYEKRPIVVIAMIPFVLAGVLVFALFPDVVNGQYHQNEAAAAAVPAAPEK